MTPLFRLDTFHPDDGAALAALHRRAILAVATRFYSRDELASWAHGIDPDAYARIAAVDVDFTVARSPSGDIVGFCSCRPLVGGVGEVRGLYVDPDYQGRGVGKQLLETAERVLQEEGAREVVIRASLSAVPFYVSQRYTEEHYDRHETRGGLKIRARWMRKDLWI